jgi:hypothetical protein
MKKIALLLLALPIWAAPIGNTAAPSIIQEGLIVSSESWIDFRLGYEGDFVVDGRVNQFDQGSGRVDRFQQQTNACIATANLVKRLDLYAIFGSSKSKAKWRFEDEAGAIALIQMKTEHNFLSGGGARVILFEWNKASLGMGGRYSTCEYDPKSLISNGITYPTKTSRMDWTEWQVNLDLSYHIDLFTVYIGTKYLDAVSRLTNFSTPISASGSGSNSFRNRDQFGLYLGCTLSNGKYFMMNLEGRLIDEEAITVSADFRF